MDRRDFLKATALTGLAGGAHFAFPDRTVARSGEEIRSYRIGDQVDPDVFFLDSDLNRVTLGSQVNEFTKVLYLTILGGAYAVKSADKRGGLWCADTVDDMPVHRALLYAYAEKGVTFVVVMVPPVYGSERYGFRDAVFLHEPPDSPAYKKAVQDFVSKTEAMKEDASLPFDPVFYDPRFRLLDNPNQGQHVEAYGEVYPWQGKFKWHEDQQTYGTPVTWLLDPDLKVLRKPFYGNVYEETPLHINYTVRDVAKALDEALAGS
jgi:hypothetical protein